MQFQVYTASYVFGKGVDVEVRMVDKSGGLVRGKSSTLSLFVVDASTLQPIKFQIGGNAVLDSAPFEIGKGGYAKMVAFIDSNEAAKVIFRVISKEGGKVFESDAVKVVKYVIELAGVRLTDDISEYDGKELTHYVNNDSARVKVQYTVHDKNGGLSGSNLVNFHSEMSSRLLFANGDKVPISDVTCAVKRKDKEAEKIRVSKPAFQERKEELSVTLDGVATACYRLNLTSAHDDLKALGLGGRRHIVELSHPLAAAISTPPITLMSKYHRPKQQQKCGGSQMALQMMRTLAVVKKEKMEQKCVVIRKEKLDQRVVFLKTERSEPRGVVVKREEQQEPAATIIKQEPAATIIKQEPQRALFHIADANCETRADHSTKSDLCHLFSPQHPSPPLSLTSPHCHPLKPSASSSVTVTVTPDENCLNMARHVVGAWLLMVAASTKSDFLKKKTGFSNPSSRRRGPKVFRKATYVKRTEFRVPAVIRRKAVAAGSQAACKSKVAGSSASCDNYLQFVIKLQQQQQQQQQQHNSCVSSSCCPASLDPWAAHFGSEQEEVARIEHLEEQACWQEWESFFD